VKERITRKELYKNEPCLKNHELWAKERSKEEKGGKVEEWWGEDQNSTRGRSELNFLLQV
jgi:hypothetical protein